MTSFRHFAALLETLKQKAGIPGLSHVWLSVAREYYARLRELWAAVGRGGAKSTFLYLLALTETLFGTFTIPTGERHYAVIISRSKEEAAKALRILSAWLTAIGEPHKLAGDTIELDSMPRGIRVLACNVGAVSGWRAFFVGLDEIAKWAAEGASNFDAREVVASARAMTVTHPTARIAAVSSAWGTDGMFYDNITAGSTERFLVFGPSPSWEMNPAITEAHTRILEPDPKIWAREYKCEFSATTSAALDVEQIDRAMLARTVPNDALVGRPIGLLDSSGATGRDGWAFGVARMMLPPARPSEWQTRPRYEGTIGGRQLWTHEFVLDAKGERIPIPAADRFKALLKVEWIQCLSGDLLRNASAEAVIAKMVKDTRALGVTRFVSDQHGAYQNSALLAAHGVALTSIAWTNTNKSESVSTLRRWLREGSIWLPPDPALRAELLNFEERVLPSGVVTYAARGRSKHDDRVACLLNLALADAERLIPDDPIVNREKSIADRLARLDAAGLL